MSPPPLLANCFRVTVGGESVAFAEVSGLLIEREQSTYRHGLSEWEGETLQTYRPAKHQRISLKRGVFAGESRFFDWLIQADAEARPMDVALMDPDGAPAIIWRVRRAIPVKITGPSLVASGGEVAVETLDVMAAGLTVERG